MAAALLASTRLFFNNPSIINSSSLSNHHPNPNGSIIIRASLNTPNAKPNIPIPIPIPSPLHNHLSSTKGGTGSGSGTNSNNNNHDTPTPQSHSHPDALTTAKLYAIMEAVADRIEMHRSIRDQRDDWNHLLLTSINALTLSAATMAAISCIRDSPSVLNLSSAVLYVAATGMLVIVNKIQPSQLAEEQRNAVRLFEQIQSQIRTMAAIGNPTAAEVAEMFEKVLAIDRAYPLPLLGVMLEKFPEELSPAVWWPSRRRRRKPAKGEEELGFNNGWSRELEEELKEIVKVIRERDEKDYLKLGGRALAANKILAVAGPVLTGVAAVGSAWGHGEWGVVGGALASVVNAVEHGGQVGMVVEMYRSNAGFFKEVAEETIGRNLREEEPERRENGELLEMKLGLQLGRSLKQLRGLAAAPAPAEEAEDGGSEFASKLF